MRDFIYEEILTETANDLQMPKKFIDSVYKAYWRAVREHICSLPLKKDLSDEEFTELQPNVNIPSIGKLYVTAEKYRWMKNKFEQIKQFKENNVEDNED